MLSIVCDVELQALDCNATIVDVGVVLPAIAHFELVERTVLRDVVEHSFSFVFD